MWNFLTHLSPQEGPFIPKGGYHTSIHALIGASVITDKQFPNFINRQNASSVSANFQKFCNKSQNSSQKTCQEPMETNQMVTCNINNNNNKKKKKKRRRRRKKKNKTQTEAPRQRQISIAESEDGFEICFINPEEDTQSYETSESDDLDSSDCQILLKKVRFACEEKLCQVHPMVMWSYAYQAARKGPWEEYARDRDRFNKRVSEVEASIGHIFDQEHRNRVFHERFEMV